MRGEIKEIYGLIPIERSKLKLVRKVGIFGQCWKVKTHIFRTFRIAIWYLIWKELKRMTQTLSSCNNGDKTKHVFIHRFIGRD